MVDREDPTSLLRRLGYPDLETLLMIGLGGSKTVKIYDKDEDEDE